MPGVLLRLGPVRVLPLGRLTELTLARLAGGNAVVEFR